MKILNNFPQQTLVSGESFVGATAITAGRKGLVPAPVIGDQNKVLYGDGTFKALPATGTRTTSAYTILASGWSSGTYSALETLYPNSTYDIDISFSSSTTDAQKKVFADGKIVGEVASNNIIATGTVPTVDIPVLITVIHK